MAKHLAIYVCVLLATSLSQALCIAVNIAIVCLGFADVLRHTKHQRAQNRRKHYYHDEANSDALFLNSFSLVSFGVGNLIAYSVMANSYAEAMPWEVILHTGLYLIAFSYFYSHHVSMKQTSQVLTTSAKQQRRQSITKDMMGNVRQDSLLPTSSNSFKGLSSSKYLHQQVSDEVEFYCSNQLIFDFNKTIYVEKKLINENSQIIIYFKFLIFLLFASVYSAQLTFTTVCTPMMKFDWFLVVKDCRLIFSNWFSAISSAGGYLSMSAALLVAMQLFKTFTTIRFR